MITDIIGKYTICIVVIFQRSKIWIFGVYDNIDLAKKRVQEQNYLIGPDCIVEYYEHIVWAEKED